MYFQVLSTRGHVERDGISYEVCSFHNIFKFKCPGMLGLIIGIPRCY